MRKHHHRVLISILTDVFDSNDAPNELQVNESSVTNHLSSNHPRGNRCFWRANRCTCQASTTQCRVSPTYYTVTDLDGMTSSASRYVLVESPTMIMMFYPAQGDCDDNNASVNPQASESEYVNGIDEDVMSYR